MQSEVKKTVDYTHETVSGILSGIISARQAVHQSISTSYSPFRFTDSVTSLKLDFICRYSIVISVKALPYNPF